MSFLKKRGGSTAVEATKKPKVEARESRCQYEVFLSFHGDDTRNSFVDMLNRSLKDAGIHTFIDEEGLGKGETIAPKLVDAIQQSSISIPVFSKSYAHSKWCLWELAEMLKCNKAGGQTILPVFYYVEPRNVRHQGGSYEEAFRKHSEGISDESTVKAWKEALREVGEIKGWEVKNTAEGSQGKIIKSIVKHVLRELKKGYLNVTDNLVGTAQHERAILKLLNADSDSSTDIVGIHGIGGIGKTTLSKVIYNRLCDKFEHYSFLEDIKDNELKALQKQLICDILKQNVDISNLDDGMSMIQQRFHTKKVLILLDDVDHPKQLEKLAGCYVSFGKGSKIIITTRNKDILRTFEAKPYELQELDEKQSLQLFSKHAFRAEEPPKDFLALSKSFVSKVDGLPLALKILGSSLYGEQKKEWESRFRNLGRRPLREVAEKLMITYRILIPEEKQIFLDIACHFIGMDVRVAIHFWNSLGYFPDESIQALLDKSLIKIGDDFKLKMHDQLQDLGRDIVRQKSIEEDNVPSRVWNYCEARDIITGKKGNDNIKGLNLGIKHQEESLYDEQFKKLTKLKFIQVGDAKLDGDFHQLLPELKWLMWIGSLNWKGPERDAPRNFNLESLVILDLSWSNVTENWNGWSQIKGKNLRVLNLTWCVCLTRTPNLSSYTDLRRLILKYCSNLVEIDKSIGKLKNLTFLDLTQCRELGKLPPELESLNALEELLIDHTAIKDLSPLERMNTLETLHFKKLWLEDVSPIFHLTSLKDLELEITFINQLLDSIGSLVNLERLSLSFCVTLWKLPETIENLKSLSELLLHSTNIVELPQAILRLPVLRTLDLTCCLRLESVLALPSNLTDFRFDWEGSSLKFPKSINLKELYFTKEPKLSQVVSLTEIISSSFSELEELTFEDSPVTTLLVEFSIFEQLKKLVVRSCSELQRISKLPSRLSYLEIRDCGSLEEVPKLSDSSTLQALFIIRCCSLREIRGLEALKSLQCLEVSHCEELKMLDGIEQLKSLKRGIINQCWSLTFPNKSYLEKLREHNNVKIRCFAELKRFDSNIVDTLSVSGPDITFFPKNYVGLKELKLSDLYSLKALPTLPQSLVSLEVIRCYDLIDWPDMSNLENLFKLVICWTMLREIQGLGKMEHLTHFKIKMCQNLTTLVGLEELVSLECLELDCCISLQILPNLSNLKKLQSVRATNCIGIDEIEGLDGLNLKEFTFYCDGSTDSDDFDEWESNKPTEVFLSFCGEETLDSFIDLLYRDLKLCGINTFRDEQRFRTGENIRPEVRYAIWQSSICIPIFSKGYAHNKWSFWELEEILQCKKTKKTFSEILPVYCYVKPADVWNQGGSYEEAFCQHSKDFSIDTIEAWKQALREVEGPLYDIGPEEDAHGSEAKLRHLVVGRVLKRLKKLKESEGDSDSESEGDSDSELEGDSD